TAHVPRRWSRARFAGCPIPRRHPRRVCRPLRGAVRREACLIPSRTSYIRRPQPRHGRPIIMAPRDHCVPSDFGTAWRTHTMKTLLLTAAVVAGCGFSILFGEPAAPVVFTVAQAEAGRIASLRTCAKCHTEALTGRTGDPAENPPLSALPDDYQKVVKDAGGKV